MAVLIDPPSWPAHGRRWSHLASETSLAELHAFARRIGVPARGFEGDHYDVPEERYAAAVSAGAVPVSSRELLRRLQASGLRRPKRRGERLLASRSDDALAERVDVLLSRLPPPGIPVRVHVLLQCGPRALVLADGEGFVLPHAKPAPGTDPTAVAERVAARILATPPGPHGQVGYLRRIRAGERRYESVVHARVDDQPAPQPHEGAWAGGHRAIALLAVDLAPLVAAALGLRRTDLRPIW